MTLDEVTTERDQLREAKDGAYAERNQLLALVTTLLPAHLCRHEAEDRAWEDDWRNIVCVHMPTGQATWHIHDSELPLFAHLTQGANHWDGHTNAEKYARLREALSRAAGA